MTSKWQQLQQQSFLESNARNRAKGLVDEGSFIELVGPECQKTSPHLRELGEAVEFDDGIVTGIGMLNQHPTVVISQEGRFVGGSVGEVGGAKMVGALKIALDLYHKMHEQNASVPDSKKPIVIISFETGGVRLHEANAGLLAHAEVMDQIQNLRHKVPVISVIGSKVGCFGGMGFVAAATDIIIMSEFSRLGLTGPEVIEQEIGREEFDSSDRALVFRTTGGKHKYIVGDCNFLVKDNIGDFRAQLLDVVDLPMMEIEKLRRIGSPKLIAKQMQIVTKISEMEPKDSKDVWKAVGNSDPESLIDMPLTEFLAQVKRLAI